MSVSSSSSSSSSPSSPNAGSPRPGSTPGTPKVPVNAVATSPAAPVAPAFPANPNLEKVLVSLGQMAEDGSLPRNIRRGAQGAREALTKGNSAIDVRVAGAVSLLDDLANDSNIPVHGRTAIWALISQLESLQ